MMLPTAKPKQGETVYVTHCKAAILYEKNSKIPAISKAVRMSLQPLPFQEHGGRTKLYHV